MKRLAAFAVLLVVLAAPAWAGWDEGLAAYNRGDYATAVREFRALATQGNAAAQLYLGLMYHDGEGVTQDYAEAAKWLRKAASQDYGLAQIMLGVMYDMGHGMPQDHARVAKGFRKRADRDIPSAQVSLGLMYSAGHGVPQDYAQAHMWFNLAAAQGNKKGVKSRDNIAKRMTPAQIAEAQRLARNWRPRR